LVGVQGLGFGVQNLGFGVQGLGVGIQGLGFGVQGFTGGGLRFESLFATAAGGTLPARRERIEVSTINVTFGGCLLTSRVQGLGFRVWDYGIWIMRSMP
jgi:hypothetical protein